MAPIRVRRAIAVTPTTAIIMATMAGSQSTIAFASLAEAPSSLSSQMPCIAQNPARTSTSVKNTLSMQPVQFVETGSGKTSTEKSLQPVPLSVVRVSENKGREEVFNLHVEGQHEFIACGVLTHNCVWACTELFFKGKSTPKLSLVYSKASDLSSNAPF